MRKRPCGHRSPALRKARRSAPLPRELMTPGRMGLALFSPVLLESTRPQEAKWRINCPNLKTKTKTPSNPFSSTRTYQNCLCHLRFTFKVIDFMFWKFQTPRKIAKKAQRVPRCPCLPRANVSHPHGPLVLSDESVLMVHSAFTFPHLPAAVRLLFQDPIRETP